MESFSLGPLSTAEIQLCLMRDVENMASLKKALLDGSLNAVLLKPKMISDTFTVIQAAHKAVYSDKHGKMKTKSVNTEILYNLSPTSKISESLKTFGVSDTDKEVLIAHLSRDGTNGQKEMTSIMNMFHGQAIPLREISSMTDTMTLEKMYKVTKEELEIGSLSDAIINRIAVKDSI